MELRKVALCTVLLLVAVVAHSSGTYHAITQVYLSNKKNDQLAAKSIVTDSSNSSSIDSKLKARHSVKRRESSSPEPDYFDDAAGNEAADDDEAQNDADPGDEDEETNHTIVTQAQTYQLRLGNTVKMDCKLTPDDGTGIVMWYKDHKDNQYFIGSNKLNAPERYSVPQGTTDMLIKELEVSDSGTYTCEVVQESPISVTHNLIVLQPPTVININATNNGHVKEGEDVTLTCDSTGYPAPQIVWSRSDDMDNMNMRLTSSEAEFTGNTATIRKIKKDYAGTYYCWVFNTAGHGVKSVNIVVQGKPRVHMHHPVRNSEIGIEETLTCTVHDQGEVFIRWYKDDVPIENAEHQYSVTTNGSQSTLVFTPTSDRDFGKFTCQAENSFGIHVGSTEVVRRPVVDGLEVDGSKLMWSVQSHQPLEEVELQLIDHEGNDVKTFSIPLPAEHKNQYEFIYTLPEKELPRGDYRALVRVRNTHDWGHSHNPVPVSVGGQPVEIVSASVLGSDDRGAGVSIRPEMALLTTTIMYLVARLL